ncbi:MAG: bifunctional folylpolyglutamate synthase/dihydrofolate synthase [Spirochaetes bacterium]|nr:bifunctional folylpolyglutamate synthase/dihydrofolate synthase [Spirochaetota bacterium]
MIEEKLERFANNEVTGSFREYSLRPITALLRACGNPHRNFPSIHIAGTNGKGTVACMLSGIMRHSGYRCGLYTSPHLQRVNERISIDGRSIPDRTLGAYIDEVTALLKRLEGIEPTYFDILTFIAFRYFSDRAVDMAVVETGLGGRLDSTNTVIPLCSVITDIDFDHTSLLGNSLEEIAREKAGIVKPGVPLVTSNSTPPLRTLLSSTARRKKSPAYFMGTHFGCCGVQWNDGEFLFDYGFSSGGITERFGGLRLPLAVESQVKNASLALTAAMVVRDRFPGICATSLRTALRKVRVPGRFEIVLKKPLIIFDPAHNMQSLQSLMAALRRRYHGGRVMVVFTLMKDKDYGEIIPWILRSGCSAVYFNLRDSRGLQVPAEYTPNRPLPSAGTVRELHQIISHRETQDVLLFTGSFRLYGTTLAYSDHVRSRGDGG